MDTRRVSRTTVQVGRGPASESAAGCRCTDAGLDDARLWGPEEVCRYLGVRPRTLRQWRTLDPTFPLPLILPGRLVRWLPAQVVGWAAARQFEVG